MLLYRKKNQKELKNEPHPLQPPLKPRDYVKVLKARNPNYEIRNKYKIQMFKI
jgi:hypothetical protein